MRRHLESALSIIITAIFVIAGVVGVWAGAGTITVLDSTGATKTYTVVTDGSGNFLASQIICDYSAGANCATVNSSHQLGVIEANSAAILTAAQSAIPAGTNAIGTVSVTNTVNVQGTAASGVAVSGNPLLNGGRAASTAPTEVTDGQAVALMATLNGRLVNLPYAIKESVALGTAAMTTSGANTIIAASGSASLKTYITSIQCGRTDSATTTTFLTFNDSKSSVLVLPGLGGNNATFPIPLVTAANVSFTSTPAVPITTIYCNAQGYYGP